MITFSGDAESSDVLWHMEAINYLHLNIRLPIVTLIWKVYTLRCFNNRKALFILLSASSFLLLLSPSFAVLMTALF